MCTQIAKVMDLDAYFVYEELFKGSTGKDYELGKISTHDLYQHLLTQAPKTCSFQDFLFAASDIFAPNHSILPLLEKLKSKGIKLVLLSNTCEIHFNFLYSRFPHLKYFDEKILSYEVGMRKPDINIYKKAILQAGASLKDSFYTDDLKENIKGAHKIGLSASQFFSTEDLEKALIQYKVL